MKVVLISLESWDQVWRRNQYVSGELIRLGLVDDLWFVEPPRVGPPAVTVRPVRPGITTVCMSTPIPKRFGGLAHLGRRLTRTVLADTDLLWINDPALGRYCVRPGLRAVYDVTDDWRTAGLPERITRRVVEAEDVLAGSAHTIVCSDNLAERWRERYGLNAEVVHNGVDEEIWRTAAPRSLPDPGPHVGYVGTLHEQRLDLDLVAKIANCPQVGTLHLVGPNCLSAENTQRLTSMPRVRIHGAVPAGEVPSWMLAMNVLISPHLINSFTQSLDAIKYYEYSVSGKPVVATPTSGFVESDRISTSEPTGFVECLVTALNRRAENTSFAPDRNLLEHTWESRARQFWSALNVSAPSSRESLRT